MEDTMVGNGLLIQIDGSVRFLKSVGDDALSRQFGPRFLTALSDTGDLEVASHELTRAALFPPNVHASRLTNIAICGPVVVRPVDGKPLDVRYTSDEYLSEIVSDCTNEELKQRITRAVKENTRHPLFDRADEGRWVANGRAFNGIVVSGSLQQSQDDSHDVWLFGPGEPAPFHLRLDEYTLLEAMEYMLEVDELVAEGETPEEFLQVVRQLGIRN